MKLPDYYWHWEEMSDVELLFDTILTELCQDEGFAYYIVEDATTRLTIGTRKSNVVFLVSFAWYFRRQLDRNAWRTSIASVTGWKSATYVFDGLVADTSAVFDQ